MIGLDSVVGFGLGGFGDHVIHHLGSVDFGYEIYSSFVYIVVVVGHLSKTGKTEVWEDEKGSRDGIRSKSQMKEGRGALGAYQFDVGCNEVDVIDWGGIGLGIEHHVGFGGECLDSGVADCDGVGGCFDSGHTSAFGILVFECIVGTGHGIGFDLHFDGIGSDQVFGIFVFCIVGVGREIDLRLDGIGSDQAFGILVFECIVGAGHGIDFDLHLDGIGSDHTSASGILVF